jgi:hypothetical protein
MIINVDMLAPAYDYLAATEPFYNWNLPPAEEIRFKLFKKWKKYAHYFRVDGVHHIEFSTKHVTDHYMLLATMAHEMIHLFLETHCMHGDDFHGEAFQRIANEVCELHGFNRYDF